MSGKLQHYGVYDTSGKIGGINRPSPTGSASAITGWPGSGQLDQTESGLVWVKYEDDNTNRKISISTDGYSWVQMVSLSRTDYLTPTQIGIYLHAPQTTPESNQGATFLHWKQL